MINEVKIKHVWVKRSDEWIKNNPGKPTLYKVNKEEVNAETNGLKAVVTRKFKKRQSEKAGLYVITCEKTKSAYVGMSTDLTKRIYSHKIKILSNNSKEVVYSKICKDVSEHGFDSLEFKVFEINAPDKILLEKEQEMMHLYLSKGYRLYNTVVNTNGNTVYCPYEYQKAISNIIAKCCENPKLIERIEQFILDQKE